MSVNLNQNRFQLLSPSLQKTEEEQSQDPQLAKNVLAQNLRCASNSSQNIGSAFVGEQLSVTDGNEHSEAAAIDLSKNKILQELSSLIQKLSSLRSRDDQLENVESSGLENSGYVPGENPISFDESDATRLCKNKIPQELLSLRSKR